MATMQMICGEAWLCKNGHILGVTRQVMVRDEKRAWRVDVLYKLRSARVGDAGGALVQVPEDAVDCRVEGTVRDIRCSVPGCDGKRTWWQGEQSIQRLLARMGVRDEED